MPDAYIFDSVRTPRGKGKKDGALHGVTSLDLATQVLVALKDRNALDTSKVDDVVLGCVNPLASQGADIARIAVLNAEYAETTAGVQVNRFCASGLEACNMAAAKVISGAASSQCLGCRCFPIWVPGRLILLQRSKPISRHKGSVPT